MDKRIIYQNDEGGISIVIPADCGLTIEQIAAKDVPFGKPYKIVDVADIPTDRSERAAWFVEETELTDGVGADYGTGSDKEVTAWRANGNPVLRQRRAEPEPEVRQPRPSIIKVKPSAERTPQ